MSIKETDYIKLTDCDFDFAGEIWQPTAGLRIAKYKTPISETAVKEEHVLQQLWVSNKGKEEWRNIPIIDMD